MNDTQETGEGEKDSLLKTIMIGVALFFVFSILAEFGCAPRNLRN